jgi:hypothetical protein
VDDLVVTFLDFTKDFYVFYVETGKVLEDFFWRPAFNVLKGEGG